MTNFEKNSETLSSLKAISFGFGLIIFVTSLIFLKPYFIQKNEKEFSQKNQNNEKKPSQNCQNISLQELSSKLINNDHNFFEIFDVRDEKKFQKEHIIDSKNISMENITNDPLIFEEKKEYIIVAENSQSEKEICKIFPQEKKEKVYFLTGGFANWKNNFQPTISAGDPYSSTDQSKISYVNSEELKKIIYEEKTPIYIIDVRDKDIFLSGHLKGSENIPLKDLEKNRNSIPMGRKIIVYDDNGILAFQAGVRLFDMGFLNVFTFSEGLNFWKQKGFEVIK